MMQQKKFIDYNGLMYLLQLLQEYPNNDILATIIEAIDTTKADIDSPVFTGTPTAPTPSANTNNTQLATTAFVKSQVMTTADIDSAISEAGTIPSTDYNIIMSTADIDAAIAAAN